LFGSTDLHGIDKVRYTTCLVGTQGCTDMEIVSEDWFVQLVGKVGVCGGSEVRWGRWYGEMVEGGVCLVWRVKV
jgi:hypothetical protein